MATISNNEIKIKYTLDTTDLANATQLFDRLSAEDRQLLNDLKRLQAQLTATGQAGQAAGNNISNGTNKAKESTDALSASIKQVGAYIGTYFSVQALQRFAKQVVDTTIKFEALRKAIEFTSGTVSGGIANFQFLEEVATKLGLPLEAAAQGFKSFSAAAGRANIPIQQQQQMFTDLSKAMAALQVTTQDAQLIFFGFSQLMSKAKVSAQELYHQIGERLPLAMEAAQIATGRLEGKTKVTTSELMKMVESGKLLSEKFAPEFTKALGELAGDAAYVETLGKGFTRLGNSWDAMLEQMGKSNEGFIANTVKVFTKLFDFISDNIKGFTKNIEFEQTAAFDQGLKKWEKATTEQIQFRKAILEKQKEIAAQEVEQIKSRVDAQQILNDRIPIGGQLLTSIIGYNKQSFEEDQRKLRTTQLNLANLTGTLDAMNQVLKQRQATMAPTAEEVDPKKNENAYKKELARLESQRKAKEDIIKSEMMDGTLRDIEIAKNNEYWNRQMYDVDVKYAKMGLELARNNRVERAAEVKLNAAQQIQLVEQANEKALQKEKEYHDRAMETLQDQQRKRKEEMQTDEQNELDADKDFFDDKIKILTDKYTEAISIEAISLETSKKLNENYQKDLLALQQAFRESQAAIDAKYRQKEKALLIESELEVRSIVVEAANIRNQALARTEQDRADIEEEAAITQIKIEKERNFKLAQLQLESTTLSDAEKETVRERQIANEILLDAKLTEIVKNGEKRRLEYKLEIANATFNALSQISNSLVNLYESNLSRERDALSQKYDSDVRLAGDNKQKLAQLAQQKARAEYEIELKQFKARQVMAVAEVIFKTAPEIAKWISTGILSPVAAIGLAAQGVAIGAILAQQPPVPPYKDGTKGRPHPGGPALVGEAGVEKVITTEGKVYYTPPMATLVDLPKGAQVIPNHALSSRELFWANAMNDGKPINPSGGIEIKLDRIGGILESLPIHQINMNEKGFEKFVRTPRRTTKILNNQFPLKH